MLANIEDSIFSSTYIVGAGAEAAVVPLLFSVAIEEEVDVLFLEDEVVVVEEEVARA